MAVMMERFAESLGWYTKRESMRAATTVREEKPAQHMVGEYCADYSGLSEDQLKETDAEMDAFIHKSRLVSEKRGL
ncbi:hypothetical protein [Mesorhizobium sp. B2-7-1]|uniref:hypothetical protein n=1 Tax=Mesorhizobium sp. B2-7-1 TaxID=2589909 RepID=UPI00112EB658|nr:hypothetical protein [Mesorhizobium sp. B2-7-1]TPJ73299.1 hypothetical protein FJ471_04910 [Mesorhizobium sp. B2-7-1]